MAEEQLKALVALAEDTSSVNSTQIGDLQPPVTPAPGVDTFLLVSNSTYMYTAHTHSKLERQPRKKEC